jgi:hypothetical protein
MSAGIDEWKERGYFGTGQQELARGNGIAKGKSTQEHNESEKNERHADGVDGENGKTQSMVPNNVVSWYLK